MAWSFETLTQQRNNRRSETLEQQQHEEEVLRPQDFPLSKSSPPDVSHLSVKDKMKSFYKNTVKPAFPEAIQDVKLTASLASLESHVKCDLNDAQRFPEIKEVAHVQRGTELCPQEVSFLTARKLRIRDHFAQYIGVDPQTIDPMDVPTIAFGGSGGGYRATIATMGYCAEFRKTRLWDLLTYVSGVSGACWSLAAYYTWGEGNFDKVVDHCKQRLSPLHPLSGEAVRKVLSVPGGTNVTLGPLVQKHHSGLHTVAMDLYSVFTTGFLFLQEDASNDPGPTTKKELASQHQEWFRWSNASKYLAHGENPLPLMTAIRHERPWKDWVDKAHPFKEANHSAQEHQDDKDAWFQWFEMSPYEIGCDELEAFVPTWAFGRPFEEGKSSMQLPEQSLALLVGLCTSAPVGPLTSYIATIARNLPSGFIGNQIHNIASSVSKMWGEHGTEEFEDHHPLHACNEHNPLFHLTPVPKDQPRPRGIENSPRIHLIDSGMDNNCPTYVLLRPEREVDVIINMDASSDVQKDNFQERVDQIGCRRGLKFSKRNPEFKAGDDPKDRNRFKGMYAQLYDSGRIERPPTVVDSYGRTVNNPPAATSNVECAMVYMPLLPNERAVPGYDPSTAKFSGSYNLVWTPEQVEMLVKVCVANCEDGEETVKMALREAWQRKKARREVVKILI